MEERNPYPKYSYNSMLVDEITHKPIYGINTDWLIWRLEHGLTIEEEDFL